MQLLIFDNFKTSSVVVVVVVVSVPYLLLFTAAVVVLLLLLLLLSWSDIVIPVSSICHCHHPFSSLLCVHRHHCHLCLLQILTVVIIVIGSSSPYHHPDHLLITTTIAVDFVPPFCTIRCHRGHHKLPPHLCHTDYWLVVVCCH